MRINDIPSKIRHARRNRFEKTRWRRITVPQAGEIVVRKKWDGLLPCPGNPADRSNVKHFAVVM